MNSRIMPRVSLAPSRSPAPPPSQEARTVPIASQIRAAIPRPIFGHGVAVSPLERFVLSKVDGRRSVHDLAVLVSLAPAEVAALFLSLSGRGAVRLEGAPRASSSVRLRAPSEPAAASGREIVEELSDGDLEEVFEHLTDDAEAPRAASTPPSSGPRPPPPRPAAPPSSGAPSSRAPGVPRPASTPPLSGARPTAPRPTKG